MSPEEQREVVARAIGLSLTDIGSHNPRVLLWLAAAGLQFSAIERRSGDDVKHVTIGGHRNMWTIHFSEWIQARWREWGGSLGFSTKGLTPWREAFLAGHTDEEFDLWLATSVSAALQSPP